MKRLLLILAAMLGSAQAETVNFAWAPNPQTPQIDVALARGLFSEQGLDVKLVAFQSGREAFEALLGGQVDLAFMAEFPAATGALRGQKFSVIADITRYRGQRLISKGFDMPTAAALAGKKLGTTLGTNVEYFADVLLRHAGVSAEMVNAGPADLLPALIRGDIDAAAMFPTFFDASKIALGPAYRELMTADYTLHNVIAASAAATGNVAMQTAFLKALLKADDVAAADPAATKDAVLAGMKGNMKPSAMEMIWPDLVIRTELRRDLLALIADEGAWMVKRGMVKAAAPSEATFRPYLADGALKAIAPGSVDLP